MGLMSVGLAAFSIDYVDVGQFEFVERHYQLFGVVILIGLVCLLTGVIGWATVLDKAGRTRIATLALVLPAAIMPIFGFCAGDKHARSLSSVHTFDGCR
jgi:ABC-type thiamin/hydroxymethylpyrimidine transport system permease subunit